MQYFNQNFLQFLKELPANNNKAWFEANKSRYKQDVEAPFRQFISDFILALQHLVPDLQVSPDACIFRIYKDVRFSKDKDPYKNWVSAMISKGGRKDKTSPGAYVQFSGEDIRLYSGCFELSPTQLEQVRLHILHKPQVFRSLLEDQAFQENFSTIRGEKLKRLPKPFADAAAQQPLLLNKSFYYFKKYKPETALSDQLLESLLQDYKTCVPLNKFFLEALGKGEAPVQESNP